MAVEKVQYEFTEDGWFLGTYYKAGDRETFHPRQVEHDLHRMKLVAAVAAAPAPAPAGKGKAAKSGE